MTPSTPIVVALRTSPAQPRPFRVTATRPLAVVACEALTEAARAVARCDVTPADAPVVPQVGPYVEQGAGPWK